MNRTGTGGDIQQTNLMTNKAMKIAASMELKVITDASGKCAGDFLIETCVSQLIRSQFDLPDNFDPQYWREKVVNTLQTNDLAYNLFTAQNGKETKIQQWNDNWKNMRESGQFNCQAGDLMAPGLALVLEKNILVINTDPNTQNIITVHLATQLGGIATSNIPLLLCYEKNHYVGLLPESDDDVKKTVEIIEKEKLKMVYKNMDLHSSMTVKKHNLKKRNILPSTSAVPNYLKLENNGENCCYGNAVTQLIDVLPIKKVLVMLPQKKESKIATAQELGRLYRSTGGKDSTRNLLR